jgi:hypothetical protein
MGKATSIALRNYSASERERWVELCRKSELTQAQFAREHGLKLSALRQWLYRSNRRTPAPRPVFEEVLFSSPLPGPAWIAEMAAGEDLTLRFGAQSSPEFIARVIEQLRRPC